jgi:hypothetical protein
MENEWMRIGFCIGKGRFFELFEYSSLDANPLLSEECIALIEPGQADPEKTGAGVHPTAS